MTEHLPCPFCGSSNLFTSGTYISCYDCRAIGPGAIGDGDPEKNHDDWNGRWVGVADSESYEFEEKPVEDIMDITRGVVGR